MPMINEAILTLEENVSGVLEIDTVMILGFYQICFKYLSSSTIQ
jgi:hypothetical protein